ncbi:MAG: glycosyltransferase, partial [Ghiorsea sp.]|nr:glycosyltransferase [Ghiorsea sp.]
GFKIIQQYFNRQKNQQAVLQTILETQNHLEEHRQANFIGSMLNHHHHRSTEFMSRWIEAKNTSA